MNALLLIDIQNDFVPGGALAVRDGDAVVGPANRLAKRFDIVVATQDWHPAGHGSFASSHAGRKPGEMGELAGLPQIMWPDHCVQGTRGAEFLDGLDRTRWTEVFRKGTDQQIDSYSGFFDNGHRKATGLGDWLKSRGVTHVFIAGIATDYCVKFTAVDALNLGFKTTVIQDACRGVDLTPGDVQRAIDDMRNAGIEIQSESEISL
jgi:nicotinamidase/pyrazinamidase